MRNVSYDTYYAAFRFGLIAGLRAFKVPADRRLDIAGYSTVIAAAASPAEIEEWVSGEPPEVVARKVVACRSRECWLRSDLADEAERQAAAERETNAGIAATIAAESRARDQQAADAQGKTVEQYRLQRNHAGMERDRRAGKHAWMGS